MLKRYDVTLYGPGVISQAVSARAGVSVSALTRKAAKRRALRRIERAMGGVHLRVTRIEARER